MTVAIAQQAPSSFDFSSPPVSEAPAQPPEEPSIGFRAPAPPVDANDSMRAMQELDASIPLDIGDQLEYRVVEDREPPEVLLVDEEGKLNVPLAGKVPAVGLTAQQLALKISEKLRESFYYQATVMISRHSDSGRRGIVYVMGDVRSEGTVEIPSGEILRVSGAILRAGGFGAYADSSRVLLIRPDQENPEDSERVTLNVAQIMESGRMDQDLVVRPNDRIFVSRRGDTSGQFTLTGAIRSPGVYPISLGQEITISQAILSAGGFADFANGARVKLIRTNEAGEREEQSIDVEEILEDGREENDLLVKAGDRIIVPEKFISF